MKYTITFGGDFKAEVEVTDGGIKVLRAVNGWGNPVPTENIRIKNSETVSRSSDKEYIVAEEYLNGETGDVDDSTILFSTFDEKEAQEYAEKHEIHDHRMTQVAIWEMEEGSCRDSWIMKKNFE